MSEEKSRAAHLVEDLSVLSRRGALSAADQQAFRDALGASATLATAHQLGLDFDQVAAVKPGDDALIAAVAGRAVSREQPAPFARFWVRALLLAAALALAGSAAAFWQRTREPTAGHAPTSTQPAPTPAPARPAKRAAAGPAPATVPEAAQAPVKQPAPPSEPTNTERTPSLRASEPVARTFDSAESVFREANAARRSGEQSIARALYLRLEHDFPASDEAHLAHVSLGNLLLAMGRPGEAEQQFASYLGGRSTLAQEALVGRAQSLAALGRGSEELRVWEGLLHDYPGSVYAGRAKQRLAELAHAAARPE